ncbi:MAG TPA: hypothetical protein VMY37_26580 [Thermoguttaceae bacterium]|nr:hypothetical protein [Thermoguttaceae bacterium]
MYFRRDALRFFGALAILGAALCVITDDVCAALIPANEVRFSLENVVVDTEFALLTSFVGQTSGVLNYFSEITDTGWTGNVTGTYAGRNLDVTYIGNTADLSSMSWFGIGTFGSETWSSSGTASFTDPPLEGILDLKNMQVGLSVSGSIGAGSITVKLIKDLDDQELIGSVAVSALDVPVLGSALEKELSLTLKQTDFSYTSREKYTVLFGWASRTDVVNSGRLFHRVPRVPPPPIPPPWQPLGPGFEEGFAGPGGTTFNQMQVQAVPEPSSFITWGVGTFVLLGYGRRRRGKVAA